MRINRFLTSQTMRFILSRQEGGSQREINIHQLSHVTAALSCSWSQLEMENTLSYVYSESFHMVLGHER